MSKNISHRTRSQVSKCFLGHSHVAQEIAGIIHSKKQTNISKQKINQRGDAFDLHTGRSAKYCDKGVCVQFCEVFWNYRMFRVINRSGEVVWEALSLMPL